MNGRCFCRVLLILVAIAVPTLSSDLTVTRVSESSMSSWAGNYLRSYSDSSNLNWSDGFFSGTTGIVDTEFAMHETARVIYDDMVYFAVGRPGYSEWYRFHPNEGVNQALDLRTAESFGSSQPFAPFVVDDKLYFNSNGINGHELHVYDGHATREVSDLFEGSESSFRPSSSFINVNGKIVFEAFSAAPAPIGKRVFLYALDPETDSVSRIGDTYYPNFTDGSTLRIGGVADNGTLVGEVSGINRVYSTDGTNVTFEFDVDSRWETEMYQDRPFVRGFEPDGSYFLRQMTANGLSDVPINGVDNGELKAIGPITSGYKTYQIETEIGIEYGLLDHGQLKVLRLFDDVPARSVGLVPSSDGSFYIRAYREGDLSKTPHFFVSNDELHTFLELPPSERSGVEWIDESIGSLTYLEDPHHEFTPFGYFQATSERGILHIDGTELDEVKHISAAGHVTQIRGSEYTNMFWHNGAFYISDKDDGTYKITKSDSVSRIDYNHNGAVDVDDLDIQREALNADEYLEAFDLEFDGIIDESDRRILVEQFANTWFGDANFDGEFNSRDLVQVFMAAEFEDGIVGNSTWAEGDWNGDGEFSTQDFVISFSGGGYENGLRSTVEIPEPRTSIQLTLIVILFVLRRYIFSVNPGQQLF
ncbi:hypothetical protein ACFL2H_11140 [Planctomycetota bacterium]